jgi:CheY-like chemotaxis protein/signal transduction histidine kinase
MKQLIRTLAGAYRAHHELHRSQLEWIGVLGLIAFPLFYLVRFTGKLPPRWDDLEFRVVATALCLLLALRRWWPSRLQPFYLPYSYLTAFYCLAFLMPFSLLQNSSSPNSVMNMMLGAVLIVFLADWRNTIVLLLTGYASSFLVYWFTHPSPEPPFEFMYLWVPLCAVLAAGGIIARIAERRAETERLRLLHSGAGSIAHEMRNPLMRVRHALDTLAQAVPPTLPGQAVSLTHEQLRAIAQAVVQGQDAVSRGLQAISVTLGQLKPGTIDPAGFRCLWAAQCVHKAVAEFAYESEAHRARMRVAQRGDFAFMGDETAFVLVLFNLIRNALFYLPTHPDIVVTLTVDGPAGEVRVHDTGPGMPAELRAHLFEEFHTRGKPHGTGLGLAFCRRAVRAFGGEIACESRLGEFTEFRLRLPALPDVQAAVHEERTLRRVRAALTGKRALVVGHTPHGRELAAQRIAGLGGVVDTVDGAPDALLALGRSAYDLLLVDLDLPGQEGLEVVHRLRRGGLASEATVPVVGLSARAASSAGLKAERAGLDAVMPRDSGPLELFGTLADVLEAADRAASAHAALRGRTALLVDDSAFSRTVMKARLAELGLQAIEAEHGAQALELLQGGLRPAVVITDMQMPGMDGAQLARAIRAMPPPLGRLPVIAATADDLPRRLAAAQAAGIDAVLVKPVDPQALRTELARLLSADGAAGAAAAAPPGTGSPAAAAPQLG